MKKRYLFIASVIIVSLIFLIVLLSLKFSMHGFFDKWKTEVSESIIHVYNESYLTSEFADDKDLQDILESGVVEEVYCVENDRIYFIYSVSNEYPKVIWNIASVNINFEDLKIHFSEDITNAEGSKPSYEKLGYLSEHRNLFGGMYADHKIFLKGNNKIVMYDITSDAVEYVDTYPKMNYAWEIQNHQSIVFENLHDGTTQTITMETIAQCNAYAKELTELKTIWDGSSATKHFFATVKMQNDELFIVTEVLNWHGSAFAIVFKYDYDTNTVQYVSSYKTSDRVEGNYSFVLYE